MVPFYYLIQKYHAETEHLWPALFYLRAFLIIAVVKLIGNNNTNSNQTYDCYLSPFISRSNDHTNSIQNLWSLLTNTLQYRTNTLQYSKPPRSSLYKTCGEIPENGDLPNGRIPVDGDLPSKTTKAPTLLYS